MKLHLFIFIRNNYITCSLLYKIFRCHFNIFFWKNYKYKIYGVLYFFDWRVRREPMHVTSTFSFEEIKNYKVHEPRPFLILVRHNYKFYCNLFIFHNNKLLDYIPMIHIKRRPVLLPPLCPFNYHAFFLKFPKCSKSPIFSLASH